MTLCRMEGAEERHRRPYYGRREVPTDKLSRRWP